MKRSFALLAPIAATVAVALSSCGSSTTSTIDPVAKAATATTNTHGARVAMVITMQLDGLPRPVRMTGSGVMDQAARKANIDINAADLASIPGSGLDKSKLHMTELLDGTVLYMTSPLLDGNLPDGKKWMKIDIAKLGQGVGLNFGQLMQSGAGQDPAQQLAYLRTVSGAKKVGTDTIRGVPTTHYHGLARLDRYPKLVPPSQRAAARATIQRLIKLSGTSAVPIDAWVDRQGLLRRMRLAMTMKIPTTGQSMHMGMQEDLYDFGVKVDVQPPSSDQVYDATNLASGALKSSGLGG